MSSFYRSRARWHVNPALHRLAQFVEHCAASTPVGARVLDVGAGDGRHGKHFSRHECFATDYCRLNRYYGPLNFVWSAVQLPVQDASIDVILCTQVLMHIDDPKIALHEFARVLAPGGTLWLSCAFIFEEMQEPYDFYRLTQFGPTRLALNAGVANVRVEPLGGYCPLLQYQLGAAALRLPLVSKCAWWWIGQSAGDSRSRCSQTSFRGCVPILYFDRTAVPRSKEDRWPLHGLRTGVFGNIVRVDPTK